MSYGIVSITLTKQLRNRAPSSGMTISNSNARRSTGDIARHASDLVERFKAQRPMRAGSLVVTVFGDAIAPHGGTVWLGSLIRALGPFGVNQRLVRTSVYRLARDGWFSSEQIGRRSYYSLTSVGRRRFHEASRHIYRAPRRQWSGQWCLVLLANVPAPHREDIRRELNWLGFAPFSPDLLAHPEPDMAVVEQHLQGLAGNDYLIVSRARISEGRERHFAACINSAWALDELAQRWQSFVDRFQPLDRLAQQHAIAPEIAFRIRTLLIHEYRKIMLRDPLLPGALLPADWPGQAAYQLCRNLYRLTAPASEQFLTSEMETAEGSLPAPDKNFYLRFGGLELGTSEQTLKALG